jgi:hypothetical protein
MAAEESMELCCVRGTFQGNFDWRERENRRHSRCRAGPNCDPFSCVDSEYATQNYQCQADK